MSNEETNSTATEKPKKRRRALLLMVPASERKVEVGGRVETQTLYTMEHFDSIVKLRKELESREMDQTNVHGIVLLRGDAVPISAELKTQVVFKFGTAVDEDEDDGVPVDIDGETGETTKEGT
jgi:hypothetical protein